MFEIGFDHTISAIIEHDDESRVTIARLVRKGLEANRAHDVKVSPDISIAFDGSRVITPWRIKWAMSERIGNESRLDALFGSNFTEAMLQARRIGATAICFELSLENKIELANLQHDDPSVPETLRRAALHQIKVLEAQRESSDLELRLIISSYNLPPYISETGTVSDGDVDV